MEIDSDLAYRLKELCKTAARDESRPVLETVHIESGPERTILVTADGFRLAAMALPITSEEPFELHVDAESMGKLMKKGELDITPSGVSINGIVLPDVDLEGYPYPDWQSVAKSVSCSEPRANIAAFSGQYTTDFLKFRYGKEYSRPKVTPMVLHWSVYSGDTLGMSSAHAWAWQENNIYYLYVLMPLSCMNEYLFHKSLSEQGEVDTWKANHVRLEELFSERMGDSIKEVTTEIPWEVWDERKSNETTD